MLRSILISPDASLNEELATLIAGSPDVEVIRVFSSYPALDEILRTIRVRKPDLLFLSIEEFSQVETLAAHLDDVRPGLPIVALGHHLELELVSKLMRLGIREYMTCPLQHAKLAEIVVSIQHQLKKHPLQAGSLADLYTFLPSKPGVGCTTIAVSTSCALAEDFGARTLLIDCDLAAGPIKFLLKLGTSASILDALAHAQNLDEDLWSQMIGKWEDLDVLHAGELGPPPNSPCQNLDFPKGRNLGGFGRTLSEREDLIAEVS